MKSKEEFMKPRKIILLSSCALLLIICILQGISKTKDTVKKKKMSMFYIKIKPV